MVPDGIDSAECVSVNPPVVFEIVVDRVLEPVTVRVQNVQEDITDRGKRCSAVSNDFFPRQFLHGIQVLLSDIAIVPVETYYETQLTSAMYR